MIDEMTTVLEPSPLPDFVETKYIKDITGRALSYIKGWLSGPFSRAFRHRKDYSGYACS